MGQYLFRLPDIGEGVAEAEIVAWHVKPGDQVREDQPLLDVMTDKATVDMTSPVDGVVISAARRCRAPWRRSVRCWWSWMWRAVQSPCEPNGPECRQDVARNARAGRTETAPQAAPIVAHQ